MNFIKIRIFKFSASETAKNWRPPRLRAFGSGGRKRNTYGYACLLTRPDCCRNRKNFEWINCHCNYLDNVFIINFNQKSCFFETEKNYPKKSSLSHEELMTLSNLTLRKLKGFKRSGVFFNLLQQSGQK